MHGVVDTSGHALIGAHVIHNGRLVTDEAGQPLLSNAAGDVILSNVKVGDTLVALVPTHEKPTHRKGRIGAAYRVFTSNMAVSPTGSVLPFRVTTPNGQQRLIVRPERTLILFDLLVAVEWDADDTTSGIWPWPSAAPLTSSSTPPTAR